MSHALIDASISPYPLVKIARGNLFLSMGHSIRPTAAQVEAQIQLKTSIKGKERENVQSISVPALQSTTELLPEEALYLLERGTIQIWNKHGLSRPDVSNEFDEETQSFREATEMTVLEGFSTFIGREGLSLEHYQASNMHEEAKA
jgi:tRNA-splicing endonuclease subunit Sen54